MKKIILSLVVLCIFASTAAMAADKSVSRKIGDKDDDVPCTCVFNKNRMWNPEKIVWNDEEWECANYKDDGTCSEVQKIKDVSVEGVGTIQDNKSEFKVSGKTPINVKKSAVKAIGKACQIKFKNGDALSGTLQNQTFSVKAAYGTMSIDTSDIVNINFEKTMCKIQLKTGDKLTGELEDNTIEFKLSGKTPINVNKCDIKAIMFEHQAN